MSAEPNALCFGQEFPASGEPCLVQVEDHGITVMFLSGGQPMGPSTQENANAAWGRLGAKMGFDAMTVQPVRGKGQRFFTAVPSPEDQHGS